MQVTQLIYTLLLAIVLGGCKKSAGSADTKTPPVVTNFAKGADISWLTQMEAAGYKFYSSPGTAMDCLPLMQSLGMNAIRLRVWVNPANGWCNNADLVAKAKRAKQLGMRIMLDIHYSDVWADPAHQSKP